MRLRIRIIITVVLLVAAGCAAWFYFNRPRLERQWACYRVGSAETPEETRKIVAWFESGPQRDLRLRELVGKWGTGNRQFDLNLALYIDSPDSSEPLRKTFSRELAWRRELLPPWAHFWSWRTKLEPDEQIASVASYLDDLAASSANSDSNSKTPRPITWREVLELQAVFQLTGAESLAPRLDPENWLSRYTRWQKMRPAKLPHIARPKEPFPAPSD